VRCSPRKIARKGAIVVVARKRNRLGSQTDMGVKNEKRIIPDNLRNTLIYNTKNVELFWGWREYSQQFMSVKNDLFRCF
jgi:hypothetical protein